MRLLLSLLLIYIPIASVAQLNTTKHWEASLITGPLLPSSISGLSDSLNMTGFRIGKGMSYYRPELMYSQGQEGGTSFKLINLSFKNHVHIDGLEDIRPFFLTGLQYVQYEPVFNDVTAAKETGTGFHLGFGVEIDLSKNFQLRNDYYFANGPGRVLLVGLAAQYSFGGDSSVGNN